MRKTAWVYYDDEPIQCVRVPDGTSEHEIRQRMLREIEKFPGVYCNQGELPCEHISKVMQGELRIAPTNTKEQDIGHRVFTETQQTAADAAIKLMVAQVVAGINHASVVVRQLDDRPRGVYNPSDPDDSPEKYRCSYVNQQMLECLIKHLQKSV